MAGDAGRVQGPESKVQGPKLNAAEEKVALRRRLRAELQKLTAGERAVAAAQAAALLEQQIIWQQARAILFYSPLPDEPDTARLWNESLAAGKSVLLPRYSPDHNEYIAAAVRDPENDLQAGRFGIPEPRPHCPIRPLNQLDLVLVPGVGFDLTGRRLGRGQGYYDRLLAQVRGIKCGVAFDCQVVGKIPGEPHDAVMDCILTPTRWLDFRRRS